MKKEVLTYTVNNKKENIPLTQVHTLVLGSGASGLNAAVQLYVNGIRDVIILTEGLQMGTSINTGSDKQTFYKLSVSGAESDSPFDMAQTYFACGSMHGDLALVESALSVRAFMNLVNLGIPFPRDSYGQFVGYKTDHDPRQRATSIGPYTSREMCRTLIEQVKSFGIEIREKRTAIEIITMGEEEKRVCGLLVLTDEGELEAYLVENLVFAVGGPGGLYRSSVYPDVHTGAIGLALSAGAKAANLPESQYGLASTKFRWNVSGTYMQVIPRLISTDQDGKTDEKEFLPPYFLTTGDMNGMVFLKGYQWPFDARKVIGGSSIIDILVYIETELKNRRVFLDYRDNPEGFVFEDLPDEAYQYLTRSEALLSTPIERLNKMNPGAIQLYSEHGIDLYNEALEVGICAQHNNGGLSGNIWWESTNIKHLFPIGEVNGSHGVTRPGGSALNAGQVGGFRSAEFIANQYKDWQLPIQEVKEKLIERITSTINWMDICLASSISWEREEQVFRERMSKAGAHIRNRNSIKDAAVEAFSQYETLCEKGCKTLNKAQLKLAFRTRQLCLAHAIYLDAIRFAIESGTGSRGSSIIIDSSGEKIHELLDDQWRITQEEPSFRAKVLESLYDGVRDIHHEWISCRPIPEDNSWYETTWAQFRNGKIYNKT